MGAVSKATNGGGGSSPPNPWKKKAAQLEEQLSAKGESMSKLRASAKAVGPHLLHGAVVVGSAAASGAAKGYFGDKLKIGGVDLRAGAAVVLAGVGVQQIGAGKKMGTHVLAVAEGIAASVASDMGQDWGARMAEKRTTTAPSTAPAEVNSEGKRLKRDGSGQPVKDASGQFVYEGEIRRIELSSPANGHRDERARERLPRSRAA